MRESVKAREKSPGGLGKKRDFRSNLVSTVVDNLNPIVDLKSLWGTFRKFGIVRDIYLSPKNRNRRCCFAFVRFATKEEAARFVELSDGMLVYGWRISSKIASLEWGNRSKVFGKQEKVTDEGFRFKPKLAGVDNMNPSPSSGSSYAEAVKIPVSISRFNESKEFQFRKVEEKDKVEVVKWDEEGIDNSWLQFCAVGVLKSFTDVSSVFNGLRDMKIQSSSSYLGDKSILWSFLSIKDRYFFIRSRWLWKDLFSSVGVWLDAITPQSRLAWVEFRGIPLHAWCNKFFMRLGWAIGEPVLIEDETLQRDKLSRGKVLILIPYSHRCPAIIKVVAGKCSFNISVMEDPVPVSDEWVSRRLGLEKYTPAYSEGLGACDVFENQRFPRQDLMIVSGSKIRDAAVIKVVPPFEKVADS
ncbi:hypothetical protein Q3G72_030471 [Acer saccharum]|nr:hypothetical protein Q3G72_030471 [Acer saccharum]